MDEISLMCRVEGAQMRTEAVSLPPSACAALTNFKAALALKLWLVPEEFDAYIVVLAPGSVGGSSSALVEVRLESPGDLAALKTGDVVIIRNVSRATPKAGTVAERLAAASPRPKTKTKTTTGSPAAAAAGSSSAGTAAGLATALASVGLVQDGEGHTLLSSGAAGGAKAGASGGLFASRPSTTAKGRRLGLRDTVPPPVGSGTLTSAALSTALDAIAARSQALAVVAGGLETERVGGERVKLFASAGWRTAAGLVVILPDAGCPPGVWSPLTGLLAGECTGGLAPFLTALLGPAGSRGQGDVGVLLLSPWASEMVPGHETPSAHLASVWEELLKRGGGEASRPPIGWVGHGAGCDLILGLLSDGGRGTEARGRTAAIALLSPSTPPKQVLAAAAGGPAAGVLRTLLRMRCVAWSIELRPPTAGLVVPSPGPAVVLEPVVLGADEPAFSDDAGCWSQTVGVCLPGTAAYRDEAAPLVAGYAPYVSGDAAVSFLRHALGGGGGKGGSLTNANTWVAQGGLRGARAVPAPTVSPKAVPKAAVEAPRPPSPRRSAPAISCTPPPAAPPALASPSRASIMMRAAAPSPAPAGVEAPPATPPPVAIATAEKGAVIAPEAAKAAAVTPAPEGKGASAAPSTPIPSPPAAAVYIPPPALQAAFAPVVAGAVARLRTLHLDAFKPGGGSEWKAAGSANGVRMYAPASTASNPPGSTDPFVGGRGDTVLPFPVAEVLAYLVEDERSRYELDAQIDNATLIEVLSPQSKVEHLRFKGVMPTAPRDFATVAGWEADAEGGVLIWATSCTHERVPKAKGHVRGTLDIGGWVLSPLSRAEYASAAGGLGLPPPPADAGAEWAGCRVSYLFRTSIGGSVPAFVVQQVTGAQAKLPSLLGKQLAARRARVKGPLPLWPAVVCNKGGEGSAAPPPLAAAPETAAHVEAELPTPMPASPAGEASPAGQAAALDLSGVWKVDKATSDSLDGLLTEMGVPWVARRMAAGLDVTTTIVQVPGKVTITEASSLGDSTSVQTTDWTERTVSGEGAKATTQRACVLPGVDSAGEDWEGAAARAAGGEAPPGPHRWYGPGSGCLLTVTVPPAGTGTFRDERTLLSPRRLRLVTVYSKGGVVRTRLTRFFVRQEGPGVTAGMPPALAAAAEAGNDGFSAGVDAARVAPAATAVVAEAAPAAAVPASPSPAPAIPAPTVVTSPAPATPSTAAARSSGEGAGATPASPVPLVVTGARAQLVSPPPVPSPSAAPAVAAPWGTTAAPPAGISYASWEGDDAASACRSCSAPFGGVARKHHCRSCGHVLCDACTPSRFPPAHWHPAALTAAKLSVTTAVRLCTPCSRPVLLGCSTVGSAGGSATLTGGYLGTPDLLRAGKVLIRLNGKRLPRSVLSYSKAHTALTLAMPPGVGEARLVVEVEGRASEGLTVSYTPPSLASLSTVDTDGGVALLTGTNLGGEGAGDAAGMVWEAHCSSSGGSGSGSGGEGVAVAGWTAHHAAILLRIPARPAGTRNVVLRLHYGDGPTVASIPIAYAPPRLFHAGLQAVPSGAAPRAVLWGASLGADTEGATLTASPTGGGASTRCAGVSVALPHAKLECELPPGAGAGWTLTLKTLDGSASVTIV